MNKATFNEPFVYAPQTYKEVGVYVTIAAVAVAVMLLTIYIPETKVIGQGLDYNFIP